MENQPLSEKEIEDIQRGTASKKYIHPQAKPLKTLQTQKVLSNPGEGDLHRRLQAPNRMARWMTTLKKSRGQREPSNSQS